MYFGLNTWEFQYYTAESDLYIYYAIFPNSGILYPVAITP